MGLYDRSAAAYVLMEKSLGKDFAAEAAFLSRLVKQAAPEATSVLDVGCGNGEHLAHLTDDFEVTVGVELSDGMVEEAHRLFPAITVEQGDMRSFRLGRRFDAVVCLSGSIGYMTTVPDLHAALATMAEHLAPGGVLLMESWFSPEEWNAGRLATHITSGDGMGVGRMVATTSSRDGTLGHLHMAYVVMANGAVEHITEEHQMGLFTDDEYAEAFAAAGLEHSVEPNLPGRGFKLRVGRPRQPASAG